MAISLLLADDHVLFREGLRRIFELEADLEVVAEARNGLEAVELARRFVPQVALLDISMPEMNGIEAARRIHLEAPQIRLIVLTIHDDRQYMLEVIRAGAQGYLVKDSDPALLIQAIRTVAAGGAYLPPTLLSGLLETTRELMDMAENLKDNGIHFLPKSEYASFSAREQEIIKLLTEGKSNSEIAQEMYISAKTVKNHVSNILHKLGVTDRTQAALIALRSGWVKYRGRESGSVESEAAAAEDE